MGLLSLFSKPLPLALLRLPAGSFSLDSNGRVVVTTLPSSFPSELVADIGKRILKTFQEAQNAQLPLDELVIYYPALKITARQLRGGAVVYLAPQTLAGPANQP